MPLQGKENRVTPPKMLPLLVVRRAQQLETNHPWVVRSIGPSFSFYEKRGGFFPLHGREREGARSKMPKAFASCFKWKRINYLRLANPADKNGEKCKKKKKKQTSRMYPCPPEMYPTKVLQKHPPKLQPLRSNTAKIRNKLKCFG